jgi:RimJ/RimL family protein N-acetyltransferase
MGYPTDGSRWQLGHDASRQPGVRTGPQVSIVQLSPTALHALAAGDLVAANAASTVPLTPELVGPDWRRIWRRRSAQVVDDPASVVWITGVIFDVERGLAVGSAGYHGPPDAAGMVEIGYAVVPAFRRQGYARAALEALLARAVSEGDVRTVRATISPDNVASRNLVRQYGFVEVGEQEDDEDGLETIFEVPATTPAQPAPWSATG